MSGLELDARLIVLFAVQVYRGVLFAYIILSILQSLAGLSLPDPLRRIFVPHVRAYLGRDIHRLFEGLPRAVTVHTQVYPGFDNIVARHPRLGAILRRVLYALEHTPSVLELEMARSL